MTTHYPAPAQPLSAGHPLLDGGAAAIWHRSAPSRVRKAFGKGERSRGWQVWANYLGKRPEPVHPNDLLPAGADVLHWGLPTDFHSAATGPVKPIVHIEKTSNNTTADVRVDELRVRTSD